MIKREEHPVWGVYDLYRTARLNVKYYSARLYRTEQYNFALEFILLLTAPSSAVAGLWFWNTSIGSWIWRLLGAIAAVAAILKPLLSLTKRIKSYSEILEGYRTLEHDLYEIKEMISQKGKYDKELQTDFKKALKRKGPLVTKEPEIKEYIKLKERCVEEVNKELPHEKFYIPGEYENNHC